eukprot:tig00020510_g9815.t1
MGPSTSLLHDLLRLVGASAADGAGAGVAIPMNPKCPSAPAAVAPVSLHLSSSGGGTAKAPDPAAAAATAGAERGSLAAPSPAAGPLFSPRRSAAAEALLEAQEHVAECLADASPATRHARHRRAVAG